jgi:hypothetical protein
MGSCLVWGQSGTTSLRGVVSDANGAVLPGASLTITDPQTGFARSVQTENDGTYQFLQLQPTVYVVEVSANGFAKLKREDVRLQVNTPSTMNFTMQVSATKVEIEVTSEAPLVNTQDPASETYLTLASSLIYLRRARSRFDFKPSTRRGLHRQPSGSDERQPGRFSRGSAQ